MEPNVRKLLAELKATRELLRQAYKRNTYLEERLLLSGSDTEEFILESSEVYMIDPLQLRSLELEKNALSRETAYKFRPKHKELTDEEKLALYDQLKEKIKREGFDKNQPILVMLLRGNGEKDMIRKGHHRLAIAIELKLPLVPVRFVF